MALEWLTFTIISVFAYSSVDLLEKVVITTRIRSSVLMAIFLTLFYPLHLAIIFMLWDIELNIYSLIAFIIGSGMSFAYLLFMRSLLLEELSRVTILGYIHPIIVAILAYLLLDESLVLLDYLAIAMLTLSASMVSYKGKRSMVSKALIPMLGLNLALSIEYILIKYILAYTNYWNYVFWFMTGLICMRMLFLLNTRLRSEFISIKFDKQLVCYGFSISMLFLIATLASSYAISLQSVSIIAAVSATQPMIILLLLYLLNKVRDNLIEEDLSLNTLIYKIISAILVVIGIYILAI